MITLKARATTGKIKVLKIWVDGPKLCRSHGYAGGIMTPTEKTCAGKNQGKANETSGHEQAIKERNALIVRKLNEGYIYADKFETDGEVEDLAPLYPLPSSFTPSKPINDPPKDAKTGKYCAQRKYNGVNILPITDEKGNLHFYTRGIKDITKIVTDIPELQALKKLNLPKNTLLSAEFIYYTKQGLESPKDIKGIINEKTTSEKATERHKLLTKTKRGKFEVKVFDILLNNSTSLIDQDFEARLSLLEKLVYSKNSDLEPLTHLEFDYDTHVYKGKELKWEGYILRKLIGEDSRIKYTFNGKASRAGAWKLKFLKDDDYIIYETMLGDSGRLQALPSKFHLGKYDENNNIIDCGWCGPGRIPTDELEPLAVQLGITDLTQTPKTPIPTTHLVAEIKFSAKQLETNALEHPVLMRIRNDKTPQECSITDEPKYYEGD